MPLARPIKLGSVSSTWSAPPTPDSAGPAPAAITTPSCSVGTARTSDASVPTLASSAKDTDGLIQPPSVVHVVPASRSAAKFWLKATLLASGLLSLAQLAVAIWLRVVPATYSIDVLNSSSRLSLNILPTVANVTVQVLHIWLGAAVALSGLWLWERRLAQGVDSFEEVGVWAGLVTNQAFAVFRRSRRLGVLVAAAYFFALGLAVLAGSAVVGTLTPAAGYVSVAGSYACPEVNVAGNDRSQKTPFEQIDFNNVIIDALTSVVNITNRVKSLSTAINTISIGGAVVNTSDLGVANPGILQSYTGYSDLRRPKFASSSSFANASLCLPGVAAAPTCSLAATPVSLHVAEYEADGATPYIFTANFTDPCGNRNESVPLYNFGNTGGFTVGTCVDAGGEAYLTWLLFGAYAGAGVSHTSFPWNSGTLQFDCPAHLSPTSGSMRIYRQDGEVGIERDHAADCSSLAGWSYASDVPANLAAYVGYALQPLTIKSSLQWVLYPAARQNANHSSTPDQLGAVLADLTGLAFRAMYSAFVTTSFTRDADDNVLNYAGDANVGVVSATTEVYAVTVLGKGSAFFLVVLVAVVVAVVVSFLLVGVRVGVFDPSDAAAVAAVAVTVASGAECGQAGDEAQETDKGVYSPLVGVR